MNKVGGLKFKSTRVRDEYAMLPAKNLPLFNVLIDLMQFVAEKYGKELTLTHIFREQSEQDAFYRTNERYTVKPWKSPHQIWHGLDFRSRDFNRAEQDGIVEYLNLKYNKGNHYARTALVHNVGHGDHGHVQYYAKR